MERTLIVGARRVQSKLASRALPMLSSFARKPFSASFGVQNFSSVHCNFQSNLLSYRTGPSLSSLSFPSLDVGPSALIHVICSPPLSLKDILQDQIMRIKRTFQPSLIRRKRKHGLLARLGTKDGRKILVRRRLKNRRRLV